MKIILDIKCIEFIIIIERGQNCKACTLWRDIMSTKISLSGCLTKSI